jgi:hypothetical protein
MLGNLAIRLPIGDKISDHCLKRAYGFNMGLCIKRMAGLFFSMLPNR